MAGLKELDSYGKSGNIENEALTSLTGLEALNFIGGNLFINGIVSYSLTGLEG